MTHVSLNRFPLEKSFNNLMDDIFSDLPVMFKNGNGQKGWAPVNIRETQNGYSVEVVAPGFEKSDFKVNVEHDVLTIAAEKKEESNQEVEGAGKEKHIRREYAYRSFKRSFTLDEKINAAAIEAKYNNGVLTLNLPKKEEVKQSAQEINIQ